jgi:serine/threonine-protein kinase
MPASGLPSQSRAISFARDTEEGVQFLRTRLRLWWAIAIALTVVFFLVANLAGVLALGRTWTGQLAHPGNWAHLAQTAVIVLLWLLSRRPHQSRRALEVIDFAGMVAVCLCHAAIVHFSPAGAHPGIDFGALPSPNPPSAVVANFTALMGRAALLPSTPGRTFAVSGVSSLPMLLVVAALQHAHPTPEATSFVFGATMWSLMAIVLATIISRVIYSLQEQVREARQLGQYTLEAKIGEGGMGVVYRARHAFLRRPTAIKLLPPERAGAQNLVRFEREVQQTSRLFHPNTIAIYDFGHTADGIFYYVMEYLDGVSFQQLVEGDGAQPAGRVVHLLRQACGALAEAHDRGLIHRDVKPANLHLCVRGGVADHVKVLDFGLAKDLDGATSHPQLSAATLFIGTPLYMAPETITRPTEIDHRADLYALGAVAYYLLTGSPPFQADTLVEICSRHLHATPDSPSLRLGRPVPPALEALVLRCLAKDRQARPASALELGRLLASCGDHHRWTEDDATRWWQERGPAVIEAAAQPPSPASAGALDVDVHGRGLSH